MLELSGETYELASPEPVDSARPPWMMPEVLKKGADLQISCEDLSIEPAMGSDSMAPSIDAQRSGGVVSRFRLFERLAASARRTLASAPPGSGKTVLLRAWPGAAGPGGRA